MFEFPQFSRQSVKNDVLSGLTVALALVPEAVAFAFVASVDPMVGLYAAFIVGLHQHAVGVVIVGLGFYRQRQVLDRVLPLLLLQVDLSERLAHDWILQSGIGDLFVDVFFEAADNVELLAQGTLYPDVIESATSGSIASTIKTHHNRVQRILELQKQGKVIEPLSELFKDEVRALGETLGIPRDILYRHPFPGPGLGVRVPGEVTPEKLAIVREGDAIYYIAEFKFINEEWRFFEMDFRPEGAEQTHTFKFKLNNIF